MFRLASTLTSLGLLLVALASGLRAQNPKVDALFAAWDKPDSPGAAVVVVQDGAVVHQKGYGFANLEHQVPITPQTRFDVASVAKQFTGLAVAMLVREGRLSVDDDIRKHLPDVPDFGKPITIGHLLHHTSGLRDWPETLSLAGIDREAPITLEIILEMVRRQRELDFPVGDQHLYSNTGYNLLAAAVAKVTGQSFPAWMRTNVFEPLGMRDTLVVDRPEEVFARVASSYSPSGRGKFRRINNLLAAQGSSSILASVEDLGRWLIQFDQSPLGGAAVYELMHQPGKLNNGTVVQYGFGVGVGQNGTVKRISHTGSWAGFRSVTVRFPEKRFAVAILANASNFDTQDLGIKIAQIYDVLPRPPASAKKEAPVAFQADPATWDGFPGTYRLQPGWLITITREGDTLMTQASREPKFKMTPTAARRFFVESYGQSIEFLGVPGQPSPNIRYRGMTAPRVALPQVSPAQLAEYAGEYWSEELRTMTRLEIHDGKLATRQRSGAWAHLLPIGVDRFDPDGGGMALEFVRNAKSEVTEVKATGGRVRNIRYVRVTLPGATAADATGSGGSRD